MHYKITITLIIISILSTLTAIVGMFGFAWPDTYVLSCCIVSLISAGCAAFT